MAKEVCKIFQDVDNYFVDGKPDLNKINQNGNYTQYCSNDNPSEPHKCKDDLQGIKAICSHLFAELLKIPQDTQKHENTNNQYVEYVMMWLGYRLFQTETYSSSTLSNFYNNHLMKSHLFNNYSHLIKKKEHLKDANLYYLKRFYVLFKEVCYITLKYSKNNLDMRNIQNDFKIFQNKYGNLYNTINECNSYLILLNSLKVAYGNFKKSLIMSISDHKKVKELHYNFKDLTPRIRINKSSTSGFNSRGCKNVNSRAMKKPSKPARNIPKPKPAESLSHPHRSQKSAASSTPTTTQLPLQPHPQVKPVPVSEQPPAQPTNVTSPSVMPQAPILPKEPASPAQQTQSSLENDNELQKTQTGGSSHKNESEDSKSGEMSLGSGKGITDGGDGEKGSPDSEKGGTVSGPVDAQDGQGKSFNGTGSGSGDQANVDSQTKDSENASRGNPIPAQTPSGTGTPSADTNNGVRNTQGNTKAEMDNLKGDKNSQPTSRDTKQENQNDVPVNPISVPGSSGDESKDDTQTKTNQVDDSPSASQITGSGNQGTKQGVSSDGIDTLKNSINGAGNAQGDAANGNKTDSSTDVKNKHQNADPKQGDTDGGAGSGTGSGAGDQVVKDSQGDGTGGETGSGTVGSNGRSSDQGSNIGGSNDQGSTSGGLSDQGSDSGGPNDPVSSKSGVSIDLWSPFFRFLFNGMDKFNKASKFVKENHQKFKDAKDKISNVYNDSVNNLKNAYDKFSSHFNDIISNIANQINQVGIPPKSDGSQSGSNSPSDGGDPSNQLPSNPQPTSTKDPSSPLPLPPLPDPLQQKQPSSQPQSITSHPPQANLSNDKTTDKTNVQLVKSLSSDPILRIPWNIIPTTWNGSGNCKPKINFMNATLVCCTSEQCSLTGISFTLVLIPIILSIVYKYLSSGWRKEMKRKKNMTKVINLFGANKTTKTVINSTDGKKQMQIIIKSPDMKKMGNMVINPVRGEKISLLNIYKLVHADPIPFINLFFLLIFFVYKRNHDTLEL
ncbi:PIR protein CIR protein [Plasmodium vinckei lentum]|uniref:PIR protein CIR protein n=1 Tax=Plasmodium vinckei lentum TaxID=138297 RepID=A0A6V7S3C8_PLAVN|nr:PIR protein CIR protein [Plasmodium vinckei lentum]